jgi:hypothetical protein
MVAYISLRDGVFGRTFNCHSGESGLPWAVQGETRRAVRQTRPHRIERRVRWRGRSTPSPADSNAGEALRDHVSTERSHHLRLRQTHEPARSDTGGRYYRCRSTAGGRAPCGHQVSAHAIVTAVELNVSRQLGKESQRWDSMEPVYGLIPPAYGEQQHDT